MKNLVTSLLSRKASFPLILLLSLCFSCQTSSEKTNVDEEEWIALFDGSDIEAWTPKFAGYELGANYKNRLVFEDSLLSIRYSPQDTFKSNFGHIFYKDKFSHYRLRATYRFIGEQQPDGPAWAFRNNGLMLHCQSPIP